MSYVPVKFWLIVPAAGSGRRIAGETPKQYLPLVDRTVIEWACAPFLKSPQLLGVVVALAAADTLFASLGISQDPRVTTIVGGVERAQSVMQALNALEARAQPTDWVLVHDAARPCLSGDDLVKLLTMLHTHAVGGILASPVADTLKRADSIGNIDATVPRENLYRALTPQMFRFELLHRAMRAAQAADTPVTDESSAVEALGLKPQLVIGRADNIKVTLPEDLLLAEQILRARTHEVLQ